MNRQKITLTFEYDYPSQHWEDIEAFIIAQLTKEGFIQDDNPIVEIIKIDTWQNNA